MIERRPELTIIAGPNGAGKSPDGVGMMSQMR